MSGLIWPVHPDPPTEFRRGARARAKRASAGEAKGRRHAKTGAGALVNPDNIVIYSIAVGILSAAALAPLIESVEGLLHVAGWYLDWYIQWTLPVAIDGFMIGSFITSLALRRRHAHAEVIVLMVIVGVLIAFSAVANFLQEYVTADLTTIEGMASPWIKASMPLLTFAAFEAIAMLTSTRRQAENAPLRLAQADVKRLKAELAKATRAARRTEAVTA